MGAHRHEDDNVYRGIPYSNHPPGHAQQHCPLGHSQGCHLGSPEVQHLLMTRFVILSCRAEVGNKLPLPGAPGCLGINLAEGGLEESPGAAEILLITGRLAGLESTTGELLPQGSHNLGSKQRGCWGRSDCPGGTRTL